MHTSMLSKNKSATPHLGLFNFYKDSSLARMINFINEAIVVVDSNGTIEMVNTNASSLLGLSREALLSENLLNFVNDKTGQIQSHVIQCLDNAAQNVFFKPGSQKPSRAASAAPGDPISAPWPRVRAQRPVPATACARWACAPWFRRQLRGRQ